MAVLKVKDHVTGEWVPVPAVSGALTNSIRFFEIDLDGVVSLKPEYRGGTTATQYPYAVSDMGAGVVGSKNADLPERLVIPDVVDGTAVTGLRPGMFYNNERIIEITLPDTVEQIPSHFCTGAARLRSVRGTERIRSVGSSSFAYTRVEKLSFPNLTEVSSGAFGACCYLYSIDIGKVTMIPAQTFMQCCLLSTVKGGESVWSIGSQAFYYTKNLKNLPLLAGMTSAVPDGQTASIGDYAFFGSRIQFDWSTLEGTVTFGSRATPVMDNTTDFWTGAVFTACENPLGIRMSQRNAEWSNQPCGQTGVTHNEGCAMFAVMHIHSALSGKMYEHPDEFVAELEAIDASFVTAAGWPGQFQNVGSVFTALGYNATVYADQITKASYEAMCAALARGAYVYTQVSTKDYVDGGHAVAIYGINSGGEMLVLDSDLLYERYRPTGLDDSVYVYRMPYQNFVGPDSNFVVVEK